MSSLLVGLLSAALSTNPPAAVGNLVAEQTGLVAPVAVTNDATEAAYRKLIEDDDAAEQDINKWTENAAAFSGAGGGNSQITLAGRIQQRQEAVKKEYDAFLVLHPNYIKARLAYGSFLSDTQDADGAAAQWQKALDLDPKNPAVWDNLGTYYGQNGPIQKAFACFDKAIELNASQPLYCRNLASALYLFRKDAADYYKLSPDQVFEKAMNLYRKAIALDPDNFLLYSDYAMSFYGVKPPRWQEGLAAWNGALKVAHDEMSRQGVYLHLARINIKLDQYADARRCLDLVTNSAYGQLKQTLTRNLNAAIGKETNATIQIGPAD